MNTLQINNVLSTHVKYFQGVYPIISITIHTYKALNNCHQSRQALMPGSHWVAVCISDSGYAEYFDS